MKFLSNLNIWDKISLVTLPALAFFTFKGDGIAAFLLVSGLFIFNDYALVKFIKNKVK